MPCVNVAVRVFVTPVTKLKLKSVSNKAHQFCLVIYYLMLLSYACRIVQFREVPSLKCKPLEGLKNTKSRFLCIICKGCIYFEDMILLAANEQGAVMLICHNYSFLIVKIHLIPTNSLTAKHFSHLRPY